MQLFWTRFTYINNFKTLSFLFKHHNQYSRVLDIYLNTTIFVLAATAADFGLFNAGSSSMFEQESNVDNVVSTTPEVHAYHPSK